MDPKIITARAKPEAIIQADFTKFLRERKWFVKSTHGNMYQSGFPDLYTAHRMYGQRWVEVKNPAHFYFTDAQMETFPLLNAHGVGVWVIIAATEEEYKKLFGPQNWYFYINNKP
jgi:hypothetical protein